MKKKTKTKVVRKSLKEKLAEARAEGILEGRHFGAEDKAREFGPTYHLKTGVGDFIRMVESWPIAENGVVQIAGTDLKHNVTAMIPVRLVRALAKELRRLGYAPQIMTGGDETFRSIHQS